MVQDANAKARRGDEHTVFPPWEGRDKMRDLEGAVATNDMGLCWQSSPEPQLVTWIIPKGYVSSHLSCHSHWDILGRRPNHPSSGYADSDRQLGQDGFGEHTLWDEMSSPVVCCPVAVKLKPEQLRVAKRLSHCCGKNLHDWCPQASRAESVSIQDCVIFFRLFLHSSLHGVLLPALTQWAFTALAVLKKGKDWLPELWVQGLTLGTKLQRRQTVRTGTVDSSQSRREKHLEGGEPRQWEKWGRLPRNGELGSKTCWVVQQWVCPRNKDQG